MNQISKWIFISLLLTFASASFVLAQTTPLRVNTMPSYSINEREGLAVLCQPIIIWGSAFGGKPPYTYHLSVDGVPVPIDDTITNPQAYAYHHYAGHWYTFQQLGLRTVRMEVTDSLGNTGTSESTIMVYDNPIPPILVAMRVERALLYLFKHALNDLQDPKNIFWNCDLQSVQYSYASTATSVMAYEEAGHLDLNDFYIDPYAELVKKGLHYVLTKYSGQLTIYDHPDGAHGIPPCDNFQGGGTSGSAGLNKGCYLYNNAGGITYASSLGLMAVSMSRANAAEAATSIIEDGPLAGWSYYDMMKDAIDLIAWYQGDSLQRGAWRYYLTENAEMYDGSTEQWPVLVMKAALDRWGIQSPVWVLENTAYAYLDKLMYTNGGCGYNNKYDRVNAGKTGGFLIFAALFPAGVPNAITQQAIQYIENNYMDCGPDLCIESGGASWPGSFYHMYAVMKGLTLHNVDVVDVPNVGVRDWYKDMVAWLTGEQIYELPPGICTLSSFKNINNCYGQNSDGSWQDDGCLGCKSLATSHAVLILLKSVTFLPPVAVIDPPLCGSIIIECDTFPPPVNNCLPLDSSFSISGLLSYHMGVPYHHIVNYKWAIDPPPNFNWQNATITGPHPTIPGFTTPGQHTICLRVEDDHVPPLYDIDCIEIWVCEPTVIPAPIAKAIPDSLMPCYSASPTIPITLDGSESYIPPNCQDVFYWWDIDGNNVYDTLIPGSPYLSVTYNNTGNLMVGLIVMCVHDNDTVISCADYACLNISNDDLFVSSFTSPCRYHGQDSITLSMNFGNHPLSEHSFNDVMIRLYQGDPKTTGVYLGYFATIDSFPPGATFNWTVTIAVQDDIDSVWVWIDPHQEITEWDELNNLMMTHMGLFGADDTVYLYEDHDTLIDVVQNDFPPGFSPVTLVGLASFPYHGLAFPTGPLGNPMYYSPNLNYNGIDSLHYLLRIFNINGNVFCDDTLNVILHVIPVNDPPFLQLPDVSMCQNDTVYQSFTDYQVFHDPDHPLAQVSFSHYFITATPDTNQVFIQYSSTGFQISTGFNDNIFRTFWIQFSAIDDSGAMDVDTVLLTIHPYPVVDIPDTSLCNGETVILDAGNPGSSFHWSNGQTTQELIVGAAGTYTVTVTNPNGCSNSDSSTVIQKPDPQIEVHSSQPFVCQGDPVLLTATSLLFPGQTTFTWMPGGSTNDSLLIHPIQSGYFYLISQLMGCTKADSVFVEVRKGPLIVFNQTDFVICPGDSLLVSVVEDVNCTAPTYVWSNGYTGNPLFFYPNSPGYYSVTVSCDSGCYSIDSIRVQFLTRPEIDPMPPQTVCIGDPVEYTATVTPASISGSCLYEWSNGITGPTLITLPLQPTTYYLTVTYEACHDSSSLAVHLLPVPEVNLPEYSWLEPGETVHLDAGPGLMSYHWSTGSVYQFITVIDTGKYWVEVSNLYCDASDTTYVYGYPGVYVPNAFTPNHDGTNDIFYAFCAEKLKFTMHIFNRWGELIFTTHDLNTGWDGTYEGKMAPVDVYTWVIEYVYTTPGPYYLQKDGKKTGMVVLVR